MRINLIPKCLLFIVFFCVSECTSAAYDKFVCSYKTLLKEVSSYTLPHSPIYRNFSSILFEQEILIWKWLFSNFELNQIKNKPGYKEFVSLITKLNVICINRDCKTTVSLANFVTQNNKKLFFPMNYFYQLNKLFPFILVLRWIMWCICTSSMWWLCAPFA